MRVGTRPRPRYELLHKEIQKHYEPLQMANGMGEEGIKFFKNLSPPQAQHAEGSEVKLQSVFYNTWEERGRGLSCQRQSGW